MNLGAGFTLILVRPRRRWNAVLRQMAGPVYEDAPGNLAGPQLTSRDGDGAV